MEPLWIFSAQDNSIDLIGAIIFMWVAMRSIERLFKNSLTVQGKILLGILTVLSLLHVFQVAMQLIFGGPLGTFTFRMWDFINYITAILFLFTAERVNKKEKY
tara:strand:- start:19311 stop:19619 length:309 start_codon:yes stop_codon:yes gene_type:complete